MSVRSRLVFLLLQNYTKLSLLILLNILHSSSFIIQNIGIFEKESNHGGVPTFDILAHKLILKKLDNLVDRYQIILVWLYLNPTLALQHLHCQNVLNLSKLSLSEFDFFIFSQFQFLGLFTIQVFLVLMLFKFFSFVTI